MAVDSPEDDASDDPGGTNSGDYLVPTLPPLPQMPLDEAVQTFSGSAADTPPYIKKGIILPPGVVDEDVLLGQKHGLTQNSGNCFLRSLISIEHDLYHSPTQVRKNKTDHARFVFEEFSKSQGRFMQLVKEGNGTWEEAPRKVAITAINNKLRRNELPPTPKASYFILFSVCTFLIEH
jgi:hypothetical protein